MNTLIRKAFSHIIFVGLMIPSLTVCSSTSISTFVRLFITKIDPDHLKRDVSNIKQATQEELKKLRPLQTTGLTLFPFGGLSFLSTLYMCNPKTLEGLSPLYIVGGIGSLVVGYQLWAPFKKQISQNIRNRRRL